MAVKGDLKLEIDEQGIEVRITIVPDPSGGDVTADAIRKLLTDKRVRVPPDEAALDKALRGLARAKGDPVTFVAAAGTAAQPATPEVVSFEQLPIPPRLEVVARRVLAGAPPARGFRLHEERVRTEKTVTRKAALPFLRQKLDTETVTEKRLVREEVRIDPAVTGTGYADRGSLVAKIVPGRPGKAGKSVFGLPVPAPRPAAGFLFLDGLTRAGAEARAETAGFLRRGAGWCDIVPFRDHAVAVAASPDGLTCLLSFTPGDPAAPEADIDDILARAAALGFDQSTLLPAAEIAALMREAAAQGKPFAARPITPRLDGSARVTVTEDRQRAMLWLRKAQGGGAPLAPAAVSDAIRKSRVRGYNVETLREALRGFLDGRDRELTGYILVQGKAPKPGGESKLEWLASFLPKEESEDIKASLEAGAGSGRPIASSAEFPVSRVEAVARVSAETRVLRIVPPGPGVPGVDVYGEAVSAQQGGGPAVKLFEGLSMRGTMVVATQAGILEKGSDGLTILLRVRPHRDAQVTVKIEKDRMRATLSFVPPEGAGTSPRAEDVHERIKEAGVHKGIVEERLVQALDRIARRVPFSDFLFAEGKPARYDVSQRIDFHVRLASGKAVTFRPDGRADFRTQDRMTRVRAGELIATMRPRDPHLEDGFDVTGAVLSPPPEAIETLEPGPGVRADLQTDGTTRFTATTAGELRRDGGTLSVMDAHFVAGDVDMSSGHVKFPGNVRVGGTVRSGFSVSAGGALEVEGAVEGSLLTSEGGITIGQGIKGEGRAILRSRQGIESLFAEQAVLLAVGSIHLHGPCVRCRVKSNGRLDLDSEKGNLVGGEVRVTRGAVLQNIGAPGGIRTLLTFGQDYLVKDQIDRMEKEIETLTSRLGSLNAEMRQLASGTPGGTALPGSPLAKARAAKHAAMKLIDQRKLQLIGLRDRFDEHVPSAVVVRGTIYPGAVVESHGRRYEARTERRMVTLVFDPAQGRIVEKT